MDHSVRGYLERRSTEALEGILLYFQGEEKEDYTAEIQMVREILAQKTAGRRKRPIKPVLKKRTDFFLE